MRLLFVLILSFFSMGCGKMLLSMYGMKDIRPLSDKKIYSYARKYKIPVEDLYQLDTSYIIFVFKLDSSKYKEQQKNHYQPLQALFYNDDGSLQSFHVNCYAGGFPNLDWNRDGKFDVFPPKQQAPKDAIVPLYKHMSYLNPMGRTIEPDLSEYEYIVLVHWNRFMSRQSKRLIKFVKRSCDQSGDAKVKILYANNDNMFSKRSNND